MITEPTRKQLAELRPIPPFGSIIRWLSEVLQLEDLTIYQSALLGPHSSSEINDAITTLKSHTAYNLCLGEIVTEDTKTQICQALATALRSIPQLPFIPVSHQKLTGLVRRIWAEYDRLCEVLSSFPDYQDAVNLCIVRHVTLELAVRAAAMGELCADPPAQEDAPIWSKHAELKKHLKKLLQMSYETQEAAADDLRHSRNEVSRWLNEIDIPPNGAIRDWDKRLDRRPKQDIQFGKHYLWRLYVGRRVFDSIHTILPKDLRPEVLQVYGRIKSRIQAHISLRKVPPENKLLMLQHLVCTGRISDAGLAFDLLTGATDRLWRRHIEAICQVDGSHTLPFIAIAEMYANAAFGREQACKRLGVTPTDSLDEGIRYILAKTDTGQGPTADALRFYELGARLEAHGAYPRLAEMIAEQTRLQPGSSAHWGCLGRLRQREGRIQDAEDCFRTAIDLHPTFLDYRTDLAFLLANTGRPAAAIVVLEKCTAEHKQTAQWKYVSGRALLLAHRHAEAREMLLECVKEPYKFGAAFLWLAQASEALGDKQAAREYRKRSAELGIPDPGSPG